MHLPLSSTAFVLALFPLVLTAQEASTSPAPAGSGSATSTASAKRENAPASAETSHVSSDSKRNENVPVFQIDTNVVKDSNIRVGAMPTVIGEPLAEQHWYATEYGRPSSEALVIRALTPPGGWHGEAFWTHQNSVFNARTFFQVGDVKPSHQNVYGGRLTALLPKNIGGFTVNFGQSDIHAVVNGNVLVPLASERTPITTDPALRPIIQKFLDAYPNILPNRPDFDPRALNTNSPQRIDSLNGTARLDLQLNQKQRLFLSQGIDRARIVAFQLVDGQNPNTELHTLRSRAAWDYAPSAMTTFQLTALFTRVRSVLLPEPNAVGPRVRFGYQIEELGPDSMFPIDRATNTYRFGAAGSRMLDAGRHTLTYGGDFVRFQLNGIESANMRGTFQFSNNFGRTAIENLLYGTPSLYELATGDLDRGYRNSSFNAYIADRWRVNPRLQLYIGLRYGADTTPTEVRQRDIIPYGCDCNNFSPRFGLAWQAARGWVVRAMYTTTFGQILPVTYQQVRNNPPSVRSVIVQNPSLNDPLAGIDLTNPNARYTPTWISPDLTTPYSHMYNLSVEKRVAGSVLLRSSYIGSRTIKLLNGFVTNRAAPVDGVPLTPATVDQRRPDQRYYEVRTVNNGGIAWFDAAQAAVDFSLRRTLVATASYTFSKAIDEGPDFTFTAANRDILNTRSQWQDGNYADRRGLSNFDSPHALQLSYAWQVPAPPVNAGWLHRIGRDWQIFGANLWKKGTPLTLYVGSDSPGFGNVDGGPSDRPSIVDASILGRTVGHPNDAPLILTRDRFDYIHPGELRGNLGRGTFRKSSIWNWNASLMRQFRLPHDCVAQVRGDAINVTNTPQFDEPQRNLSSPAFGKITNTLNDGRVFQLGVRLIF